MKRYYNFRVRPMCIQKIFFSLAVQLRANCLSTLILRDFCLKNGVIICAFHWSNLRIKWNYTPKIYYSILHLENGQNSNYYFQLIWKKYIQNIDKEVIHLFWVLYGRTIKEKPLVVESIWPATNFGYGK